MKTYSVTKLQDEVHRLRQKILDRKNIGGEPVVEYLLRRGCNVELILLMRDDIIPWQEIVSSNVIYKKNQRHPRLVINYNYVEEELIKQRLVSYSEVNVDNWELSSINSDLMFNYAQHPEETLQAIFNIIPAEDLVSAFIEYFHSAQKKVSDMEFQVTQLEETLSDTENELHSVKAELSNRRDMPGETLNVGWLKVKNY